MRRAIQLLCLAVGSMLMAPSGAVADVDGERWVFRLSGGVFAPTGKVSQATLATRTVIDPEQRSFGFGLSLERRVSEHVGLEIAGSWAQPEVGVTHRVIGAGPAVRFSGDLETLTLLLALNFHPMDPARSADLYFGPLLAAVDYDAVAGVAVEDDEAWGLQVGCDFRGDGGPWGLATLIRYYESRAELRPLGIGVEMNPVSVFIGARRRF